MIRSTLSVLALVGALASSSAPVLAQSNTVYVQCAIESYATGVIETANAINNQQLVNQEAAACTDQIATRQWFGVDKYGSWKVLGYVRTCEITVDAVESVDVWAIYGDPVSVYPAIAACQASADAGQLVRWLGEPGI